MRALSLAIIAGAALLSAGTAQAGLTPVSPACDANNTLSAMSPNAIGCIGAYKGNDANQETDLLAAIDSAFGTLGGGGSWTMVEKVDAGDTGSYLVTVSDETSGAITFADGISGYFGLVLKASNQFSFYAFDATVLPVDEVLFTTVGTSVNKKGKPQDLSHATFYAFTPTSAPLNNPGTTLIDGTSVNNIGPSQVPVPASALLMAGGIAFAGWLGSRRRK
jgi:hypothetical protein